MPPGHYPRKWEGVQDDLRLKITSGRWQPGDRLPTIGDLAEHYDVAPGTVKSALRALAAEGLIVGRKGGGTYIREHGRKSD